MQAAENVLVVTSWVENWLMPANCVVMSTSGDTEPPTEAKVLVECPTEWATAFWQRELVITSKLVTAPFDVQVRFALID